jgi:hypothetical protein
VAESLQRMEGRGDRVGGVPSLRCLDSLLAFFVERASLFSCGSINNEEEVVDGKSDERKRDPSTEPMVGRSIR